MCSWFVNLSTVGGFFGWFGINLTFLFYCTYFTVRPINCFANKFGPDRGKKVQGFDRTKTAYYSRLQPYLSIWGVSWCTLFILINGYDVFFAFKDVCPADCPQSLRRTLTPVPSSSTRLACSTMDPTGDNISRRSIDTLEGVSTPVAQIPSTSPPASQYATPMAGHYTPSASPNSSSPMLSKMRSLKGKDKEVPVKRPLMLLDLPVDVLREIITHVRACAQR